MDPASWQGELIRRITRSSDARGALCDIVMIRRSRQREGDTQGHQQEAHAWCVSFDWAGCQYNKRSMLTKLPCRSLPSGAQSHSARRRRMALPRATSPSDRGPGRPPSEWAPLPGPSLRHPGDTSTRPRRQLRRQDLTEAGPVPRFLLRRGRSTPALRLPHRVANPADPWPCSFTLFALPPRARSAVRRLSPGDGPRSTGWPLPLPASENARNFLGVSSGRLGAPEGRIARDGEAADG